MLLICMAVLGDRAFHSVFVSCNRVAFVISEWTLYFFSHVIWFVAANILSHTAVAMAQITVV